MSADDRKGIIGGSQIGAVLGFKGYVSQYDVYLAYMGIEKEVSEETEDAFAFGHIFEDPAAKFFSYKTGWPLEEQPQAFYDPEHPWMILHPDRIVAIEIEGKRYAVEIKNTRSFAAREHWLNIELDDNPFAKHWKSKNLKLYSAAGVYDQYRAQMYWYNVFGFDGTFLVRITDGAMFVYFQPSEPKVEMAIYKKVIAFHDKLESGWIPDDMNAENAMQFADKPVEGKKYVLQKEDEEEFHALVKASQTKNECEKIYNELKAHLSAKMKDASLLVDDSGRELLSWSLQKRKKLDEKLLMTEMPDIYSKYARETESKVMRFKNSGLKDYLENVGLLIH